MVKDPSTTFCRQTHPYSLSLLQLHEVLGPVQVLCYRLCFTPDPETRDNGRISPKLSVFRMVIQIPFLTSNCQGSPSDLLSLEKTQRVFVATKTSTFEAFLQGTGLWGKCSCFFSPWGSIPIYSAELDRDEKHLLPGYLRTICNRLRLWKWLPSAAT